MRTNRTSGSVIARGPLIPQPTASEPTWDAPTRSGWSGRLATVLAEAVAQGETDAEIRELVRDVLDGFAAERAAIAPDSDRKES